MDNRRTFCCFSDRRLSIYTSYIPWIPRLKWLNEIVVRMDVFYYIPSLWEFIGLQLLCIDYCKHSRFDLLNLPDLCDNQTVKCHESESPPQQQNSWDPLGSAGVKLFCFCLLSCAYLFSTSHRRNNRIYRGHSRPSNLVVHLLHLC